MNEGRDPGPASGLSVRVTPEPISLSECDAIVSPADGALVIFSGWVRNDSEGRAVSGLSYEAYEQMAEEQMREIGLTAQAEYGANSVLLIHRTGDLKVGEVSVITAVSAPHRDSAFSACRFCIDAIKEKAAIWKKEAFVDGASRWVRGD